MKLAAPMMLLRLIVSRVLSVMPLLAWMVGGGMIPGQSFAGSLELSTLITQASRTIDATQLTNYAQAILAIEPIRLKYYRQAQQVMGGNVPVNACLKAANHAPNATLQAICQRYMQESKQILQRYNLTSGEFNMITQQLQQNPQLYQNVQQEIMRLQQQ